MLIYTDQLSKNGQLTKYVSILILQRLVIPSLSLAYSMNGMLTSLSLIIAVCITRQKSMLLLLLLTLIYVSQVAVAVVTTVVSLVSLVSLALSVSWVVCYLRRGRKYEKNNGIHVCLWSFSRDYLYYYINSPFYLFHVQ